MGFRRILYVTFCVGTSCRGEGMKRAEKVYSRMEATGGRSVCDTIKVRIFDSDDKDEEGESVTLPYGARISAQGLLQLSGEDPSCRNEFL